MNTRKEKNFSPPHNHPESAYHRYIEWLMQLTYNNPVLMKDLIKAIGISSIALLSSPFLLPMMGITSSTAAITGAGVGTTGLLVSLVNGFLQQRVYGLPVNNTAHIYKPNKFAYNSATAEVIVSDASLPLLRIVADKPYDAGYAEGYILASAIKNNLEKIDFLYPAMRIFLGAPSNNDRLKKYLEKILLTIPQSYQEEMLGKVNAYNDWLSLNFRNIEKLTFEKYVLLQLLPDLENNYNPFHENNFTQKLYACMPKMGCTTIAIRIGEYTFLARVLDWPAHNLAGTSFLQVERKIGNVLRTTDIGLPLLSGAATVLNEKGLLIEINISPGDKVLNPQGMPASFFNRYCAENAVSVGDIEKILQDKKPLAAYHLTATDGVDTQSFHFYQNKDVIGNHDVECLNKDKNTPQILVVTNNGIEHDNGTIKEINHCDSNQRKNNIYQFFNNQKSQFSLIPDTFSFEAIQNVKELLLQMVRLPLVNNCESVLCAFYVYHNHELMDASAVTDNMYAQSKELSEFRRLTF